MFAAAQSMTIGFLLAASAPVQDRDPAAASSLLEQANASYQARRSADAVRLYRLYLARFPGRADVHVFLGAALLNEGQSADALEQAGLALKLDPKYSRAHVLAGRVHAGQAEWSQAQTRFNQALHIDPRDKEALYFSGRAYYDENRFEKCVQTLRRLLSLGGNQSRVHEVLALSYEGLGDFSQAEAHYRRATDLAGAEPRPFLAYGAFLLKQGNPTAAITQLRQSLRLNPPSSETRFELAKAHLQASQPAEAIPLLREAIAISGECRFRALLAKAYLLQGLAEDARRELALNQECWQDQPPPPPGVRP